MKWIMICRKDLINMKIDYRKCGDYYIPNLVISNTKTLKLGKYGKMKLNYLKTQKKAEYTILLMNDKLNEHLQEIDETHLEDGLSAVECKDLSRVIVLYNNLQDILEKEIYFKGGMDAYYYFKRIGVIR